jgi:hypothetical protein
MYRTFRTLSLAAGACFIAAQAWAADGVLLAQKVTMGAGPATTHQIQIEPRRMRVEMSGGMRGGAQTIVFDGTRGVMMMIDDARKTYSEITKADIDRMSQMMSDALKSVPPEQRAQIEAMMRGRGGRAGAMGGAAAAKPEYRKAGTGTVGKWTCERYEAFTGGQKTGEICTVDPSARGFTAADFAITKDLAAFFEKLMPGNASQMFRIGTPEDQGFSGVPVRSTTTVAGQTITSEITDAKRQSFPDSLFQPPAGYQKQPSPFGAMGRGRRGGLQP